MKNNLDSNLVFFSYSWKDQAIAMKIFYDLTRSNISVWRDQVNAEKTDFNFLESIFKVIDNATYFLLIDSPHSRTSFFVSQEIQYFLKKQAEDSNKKLILCLVGNQEETHQTAELFYQQNYRNFFNFSGIKVYDTHKKYRNSITQLIENLGGNFVPWTDLPDGKDFEDEISATKISDEDRKSLISDFDTFKLRYQNNFPNLDRRLLTLIDDCKNMGVSSITPYISLGVFYAEQAKIENNLKKLAKAKNIFIKSCKQFPNDPRAWRGLGGTAFHLENYEEALHAYTKAREVTIKIQNKNHLKYLNLIRKNRAETLIKLEKVEEALAIFIDLWTDANRNSHLNPNHFINVAFCYFFLNNYTRCEAILLEGLKHFSEDASILIELGDFYRETQYYKNAIYFYEKVVKYCPESISLLASLSDLVCFHDDWWKFEKYANLVFKLTPNTELEHYLVGKIYFLKGESYQSRYFFNQSNGKIGPYYDEL